MRNPKWLAIICLTYFGQAAIPLDAQDRLTQPLIIQQLQEQAKLNDGFSVKAEIIVLRAQSLELDRDRSLDALARLGDIAMDRVTVELLKSVARTPDEGRRHAAAAAMLSIGERAKDEGFREFAGSIGEDIYLSSHAVELRRRAHALFMLLDTERARRHRVFQ